MTTRTSSSSTASVIGLFLLGWIILSVVSYYSIVATRGTRFDFYPRWEGARAALQGENPYSADVTERIQRGMFGRVLNADEDQQRFAYNALIIWLLLPFWLLPFPIAVSLWCGFQLLLLLCLPIFFAQIVDWKIRPTSLSIILLFSVLAFRYPINAYLIGQFIPFVFACLVMFWWGQRRQKPVVMVASLTLMMVRPEVVLIPLIALLPIFWVADYRKVVIAWVVLLFVLWVLTRLLIGPWEMDFINGLGAYQAYSAPIWAPGLLRPWWLRVLFLIVIINWSFWMAWQLWATDVPESLGWILSASILIGHLTLPQTGNYTLILGLLAAWIVLWVYKHHYMYWGFVIAVLCAPWIFHTIGGEFVHWEHIFIPTLLGALLTMAWQRRKTNLQAAA